MLRVWALLAVMVAGCGIKGPPLPPQAPAPEERPAPEDRPAQEGRR